MASTFDAEEDSDDDVFEAPEKEHFLNVSERRDTPSPTGYRGYVAPALASVSSEPQTTHKTILLGDSGVGKTSLLVQFDTGTFKAGTFSATVGIGFTGKTVTVDEERVKLQIWDTAGQERFRSVTHAYYRDAHALLLLYDVTNRTSFDNIRAWLGEIRDYAHEDVVIMLIGNKADCDNREVGTESGKSLAKEYDVIFLETSAKSGLNVDLAFSIIGRQLLARAAQKETLDNFSVQEVPFQVQNYAHIQSPQEAASSTTHSACLNCNG